MPYLAQSPITTQTIYRTRGRIAEIEAARRTLQAAGVTVLMEFDATPVSNLLSADEETALSLALCEAVTNIVRHANATTCQLGFIAYGAHRRLVIHDDGKMSPSAKAMPPRHA